MYKFGKGPPRSLMSFGVAGLLQENCYIFYESIFSTTHLGRISDLLAARLRKAGPDELRLRALLLLSGFESYRSQVSEEGWGVFSSDTLKEPLIIECGIDSEKIAIGVSFNMAREDFVSLEGLAARLLNRSPDTPFEDLLCKMLPHSDRLLLRNQPEINRYEVISIFALPGKMDQELLEGDKFEYIEISKEAETQQVSGNYVELGDLDYPELLKADSLLADLPRSKTGDILAETVHSELKRRSEKKRRSNEENMALQEALVRRGKPPEDENSQNISGADVLTEGVFKVTGSDGEQSLENQRVKGAREDLTEETTLVKGSGEGDLETLTRVRGDEGSEEDEGGSAAQISLYKQQIATLSEKVSKLQDELSNERMYKLKSGDEGSAVSQGKEDDDDEEIESEDESVIRLKKKKKQGLLGMVSGESDEDDEDDEDDDEEEDDEEGGLDAAKDAVSGFAKKIWGLRKKLKNKEEEEEDDDVDTVAAAGSHRDGMPDLDANAKKSKTVGNISADPILYSKELILNLENGKLNDVIRLAQQKALSFKKKSKARAALVEVLELLIEEKNKLRAMSENVNLAAKKQDIDFRNKERSMQDEIKRRGAQLKQKDTALQITKDQLSQVTMNMERMRGSTARGSVNDTHLKKKYEYSQKMLTAAQKELSEAKKRMERMKVESIMAEKTVAAPTPADQEKIKEIEFRHRRQLEEIKKVSTVLRSRLERSDELTKGQQAQLVEVRQRLEKANQVSVQKSSEIEKLKAEVERLRSEGKKSA